MKNLFNGLYLRCLSLFVLLLSGFSPAGLNGETVKIWSMGDEAKKLKQILPSFNKKYPQIQVEVQAIPWGNARDKILTAIAGNTTPDLSQMGTTWMPEFSDIGIFEDLRPYLRKSSVIRRTDFFKGALAPVLFKNKVFGIPWYVDTRVLFYRTDLLKEVGYPKGPQTWDELYDAAQKLKKKHAYGLALSPNNDQEILPFIWQNNARVIDKSGKSAVSSPAFAEALSYYTRFFREDLAPKSPQGSLFQNFASGRTPMFFSGPWMIRAVPESVPQINGKWSVALMPLKKTRTSFIGGSDLVIFKNSKRKESAWKFLEFMGSRDGQIEWYKITNSLPANKKAWNTPLLKNPIISVFQKQLEDTRVPPTIAQYARVKSALEKRVEEISYGKKTVPQAVKRLKKDLKRALR